MSTLKDVAGKAGVSIAAASTALSGRSSTIGVSAETRARILSAAKALGYRRDPHATSLRTGQTYNIGIWLPKAQAYLAHPQGARNFWGICEAAAGHGYHASIVVPDRMQVDPRLMDGCLIMGAIDAASETQAAQLATDIPVLSMTTPFPGAILVREDRSWGVSRQRAAGYLYDLGHRRMAVTHLMEEESQRIIPSQFEAVAREHGITAQLSSFGEANLDRRYPTIGKILDMDPLPTAAFAIDDDYARNLIGRLMHRGLRVPDDVSVFSGSTLPQPDGAPPGLTGLVLHYELELEELFRKFVNIIEKGSDTTEIRLRPFEVDLVERDSCAPPRE